MGKKKVCTAVGGCPDGQRVLEVQAAGEAEGDGFVQPGEGKGAVAAARRTALHRDNPAALRRSVEKDQEVTVTSGNKGNPS